MWEGVLSWIVENVEKTEGRSVQGSENGGFFVVLRNQIPKFGVFICIFTLKIQIICGFEPFQAQTCQIISSDVGSWLSLFSIKEGLQHTRRTMVVEQRCSQTLGQTAAKKHCKFVNVVLKQLLKMPSSILTNWQKQVQLSRSYVGKKQTWKEVCLIGKADFRSCQVANLCEGIPALQFVQTHTP